MRSEILVHRWGPGTRIYFGTFIVSSVALASSQYGSNYRAWLKIQALKNYQHAIDFHKCIFFPESIVDRATLMVWIGFSYLYCYTILLIFVIVGLVISPVFVSIRIQFSSVRPHPVIFIGRVWKSNPVTTVISGRQKLRFYEIIFFKRFNLYQSGLAFFTFLLCLSPTQSWWRNQFITWRPVANPILLTSWIKTQ